MDRTRRFADRKGFVNALTANHSVRLHAMLLLAAATISGMLVSKFLLWLGLTAPFVRFPIAVLAGYALFLVFVEWWLRYLGLHGWSAGERRLGDGFDIPSISGSGPSGGGGGGGGGALRGGGGSFDGGGASASWQAAGAKAEGAASARSAGVGSFFSTKSSGSSGGGSSGGDGDAGDAVGLLPVLLLLAVVIAIAAAAGWVIVVTPDILVEVATEVAVAAGFIRGAAPTREQTWITTLFHRSIAKAAVLAGLAVVLGFAVRWVDPGANTVGQALARLTGN